MSKAASKKASVWIVTTESEHYSFHHNITARKVKQTRAFDTVVADGVIIEFANRIVSVEKAIV